jgi:hypothetical protein
VPNDHGKRWSEDIVGEFGFHARKYCELSLKTSLVFEIANNIKV